jgi:hypothetical protein
MTDVLTVENEETKEKTHKPLFFRPSAWDLRKLTICNPHSFVPTLLPALHKTFNNIHPYLGIKIFKPLMPEFQIR